MTRKSLSDQQTWGDVIISRCEATKLPTVLKPALAAFKKSQGLLAAANKAAEAAREARDDALAAVGKADAALDSAFLGLANKAAGAGLGSRKSPLAAFSKLPPAKITNLAYADEVKEVLSITSQVKKTKPAADVVKAAVTCETLAKAVTTALAGISKPQLAYAKAIGARDALLPAWTKGLDILKKTAAVAWIDDQATYQAIFAPPDRVQAPVHARAKKKSAAPATANASVTTPPVPTTK